MNHIFGKKNKIVLLAIIFIFLAGCNYASQWSGGTADAKETVKKAAWIAYWDLESGEKDLQRIDKNLDKVSYFGAYFDPYDRLFIPQEIKSKQKVLKNKKAKYETYLTFVNDKQNADGSEIMKDTAVLRRVLLDPAVMEEHINEIITLTLQGKYDGVEIDYERIWKDEKIGPVFLQFVNQLYVKTQQKNLKLRVVLEPGTPFSSVQFPQGPEYIVMLYNLYGLHSEPGPKANKVFIEKIIKKMKPLPGEPAVAFSTGGCLWGDNGKKSFLTEAEAKSLAVTYDSATTRDKESQCIIFKYNDAGVSYEVWYADVQTLNYWIAIAKEQGINNISLWRFGGNIDINKIK